MFKKGKKQPQYQNEANKEWIYIPIYIYIISYFLAFVKRYLECGAKARLLWTLISSSRKSQVIKVRKSLWIRSFPGKCRSDVNFQSRSQISPSFQRFGAKRSHVGRPRPCVLIISLTYYHTTTLICYHISTLIR